MAERRRGRDFQVFLRVRALDDRCERRGAAGPQVAERADGVHLDLVGRSLLGVVRERLDRDLEVPGAAVGVRRRERVGRVGRHLDGDALVLADLALGRGRVDRGLGGGRREGLLDEAGDLVAVLRREERLLLGELLRGRGSRDDDDAHVLRAHVGLELVDRGERRAPAHHRDVARLAEVGPDHDDVDRRGGL